MPFTYKARNETAWQKRAEQTGNQYDGYIKDEFKMYSLRKGENMIRILPPTWENPNHYGYDVWVHYSVGPNKGTVLCLQKMKNKKCPICEAHGRAELAGREDAKDLKPGRRVLVWLLDRKEETVPLLWPMPWQKADKEISMICKDRQSGELYQIDHPEAGYDVYFNKEGEMLATVYSGFQLARRPSEVNAAHVKYVEDHPIPTTLLWRDYDEVKFLFEGEGPVDTPAPTKDTSDAPSQPPAKSNVQKDCTASTRIKGVKYVCRGMFDGHFEEHNFEPEQEDMAPVLTLVPQEFCPVTINVMKKIYGCGIVGEGHKGDHDFTRELGEATPTNGKVTEKVERLDPGKARASAMKTRFETGSTKTQ
jgi:hypothetical protein